MIYVSVNPCAVYSDDWDEKSDSRFVTFEYSVKKQGMSHPDCKTGHMLSHIRKLLHREAFTQTSLATKQLCDAANLELNLSFCCWAIMSRERAHLTSQFYLSF